MKKTNKMLLKLRDAALRDPSIFAARIDWVGRPVDLDDPSWDMIDIWDTISFNITDDIKFDIDLWNMGPDRLSGLPHIQFRVTLTTNDAIIRKDIKASDIRTVVT